MILAAARREEFDADFCSMRPDGRYDLDIPEEQLENLEWKHPKTEQLLRVIGHVPAKRYLTKDVGKYGSLGVEWHVDFAWLNPPYTRRLWAVFLEKAAQEVAAGRAGIIVALVPMDTFGEHIWTMFDENAYRIELSSKIPFFMRRKITKSGDALAVRENVVETIRGNAIVVFGKGAKTRDFLDRLVDALHTGGFITGPQSERYHEYYSWTPRLRNAA